MVPFVFFSYLSIFWHTDWIFFFITKNTNADTNVFFLTGNVMSLKSNSLARPLPTFLIFSRFLSPECTYLIKHHLKHSLSLIFGISVKHFLDGLTFLVI